MIQQPGTRRITAVLLGVGIAIRLRFYLANISLEVAEAQLSLNLIARSFSELLLPLDGDQAAPIGFLLVERLALQVFGNHELALRAFPMLCGIASLFLFHALARRVLPLRAAQLGLFLFAISPMVMHWSNQVKQYSSDVTLALLVWSTAVWARRRALDGISLAVLALVGALAIWFSHPAIFVLAGVGGTWAAFEATRGRSVALARLAGCGAIWLASFGALYAVSLRDVTSNAFLLEYWAGAFMPLPPHSIADLKWFPATFLGLFQDPGGFAEAGLAGALFLIGLVAFAKRDLETWLMLVSPILLALLASGLERFPFSQRVILFVAPVLVLMLSEGVDWIRRLTWHAAPAVTLILVGVLVFDPLLSQTLRFVKPRAFSGARGVVSYLGSHIQDGEGIYLYGDSISLFRYYAPRSGLAGRPAVPGTSAESNWDDDLTDLSALRGRVWLMFSHVHGRNETRTEEDFFLFQLDRMGRQLDSYREEDAAVHLYDLGQRPLEAPPQ